MQKLNSGSCEKAETCISATEKCYSNVWSLNSDGHDAMICQPNRRWMYCHAWKQKLGMVFDKDLGVHILPRCSCCGANLKKEMMERAGLPWKVESKQKMACYNDSCIFLKGTACSSDYYNMIQNCAYRIKERRT